jgi:hypothetical protein
MKKISFWSAGYIELRCFFLDIKRKLVYFKRRIWNVRILLWWHRLYLRHDEFHPTLNRDPCAYLVMNPEEREAYDWSLAKRKWQSHLHDLELEDRKHILSDTKPNQE